ncbi:MAG: hypothetical protein IPL78_19015 [Chloroflexi bacterium]|nr:hypothetical protein [Chloroflexota bacterium]
MQLAHTRIVFEENDQRLKITLPLKRTPLYVGLYTVLLTIWAAMTVWVIIQAIDIPQRNITLTSKIVLFIVWLIWMIIWIYLGRRIWRWWQFNVADREILFINKEELMVRRPVSILGLTDVYDMNYVEPFAYDDQLQGLAFKYGSRFVLCGLGLTQAEAHSLIALLNRRFFPHFDDEE